MNIFVASLPFQLEEADVRQTFEEFGTVSSVKLILDKETGKKRGYGFVEMPDDEEGLKAINQLNGAEFLGRAISVSKAETRDDNRPRNNFSKPRSGGYNREGGFDSGNRSFNKGGGFNRSGNSRNGNTRDNSRGDSGGRGRWQ